MIQQKICLLGSFSVGKTSLIRRYVDSLFTEKYLTTVGVKIDKKQLEFNGKTHSLMIWDIAGEDDFTSIRTAYLRGMSGYIIVIDPTRPHSYETALSIHEMVKTTVGELPAVFSLNKADLKPTWQLETPQHQHLQQMGHPIVETSAKQNIGVETMFLKLVEKLGGQHG
ncbi:small GTP-binding protein domain-containing protein [Thiothrix caldifontis]|jgi:small GTP-binding protein domain|uniref:Small GTP-binding protein domain-containing protein n=1 Tax=Thiothrix caldifontis TaxID=525918 RepID=A0A1H4BKA1_9GAMM|nr:Rab family GTPase [Thiothrix caldifontis]SEA48625.1 small GTP-binding protein domain-containing protein [Thiothrix caldifontis]